MAERIRLRQNSEYQVEFQAADPHHPDSSDLIPVQGLHEITPYTMMLFSLAGCTAQVVLGYSTHHEINLDEVEVNLIYERDYQQDCENCEEIDKYQEHIIGDIKFLGDLSSREREKLLRVSRQCPIEKMFEQGIPISIELQES